MFVTRITLGVYWLLFDLDNLLNYYLLLDDYDLFFVLLTFGETLSLTSPEEQEETNEGN